MRERLIRTLRQPDGTQLIFFATLGIHREDNLPNSHRLFRHKIRKTKFNSTLETAINATHSFDFAEVNMGKWYKYTKASVLLVTDLNNDGIDDVVLGNRKGQTILLTQQADATWTSIKTKGQGAFDWRNAKLADMDGDGINDVVLVNFGGRHENSPYSKVSVYKGSHAPPYFDFVGQPMFQRALPFAAPDVAIVDSNRKYQF